MMASGGEDNPRRGKKIFRKDHKDLAAFEFQSFDLGLGRR
jgi:hypothetical protein